ncbi:hypothetical protein WJX77_012078 [Trebouxia sp. C0004]
MPPTKEATHQKWQRAYEDAVDSDQWGQKDEAVEEYDHLRLTLETVHRLNKLGLSTLEVDSLKKMCTGLQLRVQALSSSGKSGISFDDMQRIKPWFATMLSSTDPFPVFIPSAPTQSSQGLKHELSLREKYQKVYDVPPELVHNAANVSLADGGEPTGDPSGSNGSLLPPVSKPLPRGGKLISFKIEKWGFKDEVAKGIQDAYVTISLVDGKGNIIGRPQDTPTTNNLAGNHLLFNCEVHVQQGIESIPRTSALFFEFKRWKLNKEMIVSKAYCFIDWDQLNSLQPGKCALEVYKSPADFSRKTKPSILSVKPLYLHLIASTHVA